MPGKTKTKRQVRFLFSSGSPLTGGQKDKLERELHSGAVKIEGGKKKRRRSRGGNSYPMPDRHGYY